MAKLAPPPPTNQDVASRQFRDWFYSVFQFINQQTGTFGTMAYENANSVAITGGSIGGVGISGSNINSTPIGTINPSTGKFTDLSSSGAVSGTGFTNYFASPPSLGSTTPNTGKFTSLQATGTTILDTLTGYLKGSSGTVSAVSTIPYSDISGTPTGLSVTITTAKLTPTGTNGSMTFTNGILTSQTQAT
jgi:hypothetical protein